MIHSLNILPALSQPSATNGSLSPATRQQDSSSNKTAVANNKMDRYSPVGVVESSDNAYVTHDQKSRVETSTQTVMVGERYHPLPEVKNSPSLPLDIYQPIGEVENGKPATRQQDSSSNKTAVANNKMDRYSPVGVVESSDNTDVTYDQKSRVETSAQTVMVEERYHPLAEVKKSPSLPLDIYQPIGEVGNGKPETAAGSIVALVSEQV